MRFATPTQRHLVIAAELRPQDPSPNWALLSRLPSGTDAGRFADAVASTLNANQAFTEIFERDGEGRVVVTASPVRPPVEVVEYPDLAAVQAEVARWGDHAFDLSVAPLYHAEIGVVGSDSYFMFAGAHVLSDGFGFYNLIADFAGHYADSGYRSPDTSSPADTLEPLTRNRFEVVRHFARIFDGMTALQIDGWDRRDSRGRIPGGISRCELPFRDYQAAKALGASVGARRYAVLLSVLAVTVGCLAGVDTVVVSTPMSNRRSGLASQTTRGVRVNALPVRCYIGAETVFADLCRRTEEQIRGLIDFEQHAFSEFSRTLFPAASMDSTQPSVGFTLYPRPLAAVVGGRTGETINVDRRFLQYPLTVDIEVDEGAATLIVERADHLPHTDIGALYTHVLRQVLDSDARIRLGEITWTSGELASSVPPVTEFPARTMAAEFAAAAARHA
ncbi:MAG: hypothetical protein J2P18_08300, partial [Nocardia sp.]|nr:hypothetical protein [Nocardia sp.]